jgi:hypothetical protein
MERILFVLGISVAAFVYGVATVQYEVFPYRVLKEAKLGLEAWAAMDRNNSRFPKAFEKFEEGAAAQPQAKQLDSSSGNEFILVTGGPYQLMDRCPKWGCMAWITDRAGKVLHAWEVNLEELWKGLDGVAGDVNALSLYPVGMALGKDGSLVASFQGRETFPVQIGIMKVDRAGKILWKRFDRSHHWIVSDDAGNIYTPFASFTDARYVGSTAVDLKCETKRSGMDGIRVLSAEGKPLRELPIVDSFIKSGLTGWFYNIREACNPTHLNSIALVTDAIAKRIPGTAAGDFLVSLRETNAVALMDGKTGAVKYVVAGRTAAQHSPRFLPDGSVLVFDNLGGDRSLGGSRVVRMNLVTGSAETVFPRDDAKALLPVQSKSAGHIDVSGDGKRALVSVTHQGRIVEIDVASGRPLWAYDNTHEIGKFLEANGLGKKVTRARFSTYGAYYVPHMEFLK